MTANAVTADQCEQRRQRCAGRSALPLRILLPIILALSAGVTGGYMANASEIRTNAKTTAAAVAAAREQAAATQTELRLRSQRIDALEAKLDDALARLADIQARIGRSHE